MKYAQTAAVFAAALSPCIKALQWSADEVRWNLNQNQDATHPTEYWGEWEKHTFHPSPANWRIPFYVLTVDRYTDGDPTNNEANGTVFEHNWMSNQLRFGGDVRGLMNHLDYIQGMGIKVRKYSRGHLQKRLTWRIGALPGWKPVPQYAVVWRRVWATRLYCS